MVILSFNTPVKVASLQEQLHFSRGKKNSLWTKFTREILVDLIHLQDDVIGNASLCQEDV